MTWSRRPPRGPAALARARSPATACRWAGQSTTNSKCPRQRPPPAAGSALPIVFVTVAWPQPFLSWSFCRHRTTGECQAAATRAGARGSPPLVALPVDGNITPGLLLPVAVDAFVSGTRSPRERGPSAWEQCRARGVRRRPADPEPLSQSRGPRAWMRASAANPQAAGLIPIRTARAIAGARNWERRSLVADGLAGNCARSVWTEGHWEADASRTLAHWQLRQNRGLATPLCADERQIAERDVAIARPSRRAAAIPLHSRRPNSFWSTARCRPAWLSAPEKPSSS